MRLPWSAREDDAATRYLRWVGWTIVVVSLVVTVSLVVRRVDLNPFVVVMVAFGLASGLVAARTGRALLAFVLLYVAAFPTIFGWYVFFYLPLFLLLAIGGVARLVHGRRVTSSHSAI